MTEHLAKFLGREVKVVLPSTIGQHPPHTVHGTLLSCDDDMLCVRGRNGKHFLVPLDEFAVITVFGATATADLPRPV